MLECTEDNHLLGVKSDQCQCGLLNFTHGPEGLMIISFLIKPKNIVYTRKLAVGDEVVCTRNPPYQKRTDLMAKFTVGKTYLVREIREVTNTGEQVDLTIENDDGKIKSYSVRSFAPVDKRIYISKREWDNPKIVEPNHAADFLDELSAL